MDLYGLNVTERWTISMFIVCSVSKDEIHREKQNHTNSSKSCNEPFPM